jgi:ribosomal protein S18 acetylase RimI-like enzyme
MDDSSPGPPLPPGLFDLPPGTIAAVVTYLERRAPPAPGTFPPLAPRTLAALGADVARYRALFAAVGEPWLWTSRRLLDDAALAAILGHPDVAAFAVRDGGRDVGLVEIDWREPGEAEIAFFGLVPDRAGRGIGPALMGDALARAFARPVARVWLHTCTQDHPAAVGFYLACGFRCYRRAIEVAPDPRLTGHLPRDAGLHHPVIEGATGG